MENSWKQKEEIFLKRLFSEKKLQNVHQSPRLVKVVLNRGWRSDDSSKVIEQSVRTMSLITGQKPVLTRAKKSIAGFKLREGQEVGCFTTLRGRRAKDFLRRLVMVAIPRTPDFRGISKNGLDGRGNFSFGLTSERIFPEINADEFDRPRGFNVTICLSTSDDKLAFEYLREVVGVPFKDRGGV